MIWYDSCVFVIKRKLNAEKKVSQDDANKSHSDEMKGGNLD